MTGGDNTPSVTAKGIVLAILLSLTAGFGLSEALLRLVMSDWREFYSGRFMSPVTVPGYSPVMAGRPGFDGHFSQNNGDFRIRIQLNQLGHRNPEEASEATGQIWAIGDSMTFGWGVERTEMYSEVLEELLHVPVYNLASPGTDICGYQTMAAQMPKDSRPPAIIVGLILENDVRMYDCPVEAQAKAAKQMVRPDSGAGLSLLKFKRYATQNSALYNFFAVSLKRVALVQDVLVRLRLLKKPHTVQKRVEPEKLSELAASTVNELVRLKSLLPPAASFLVLVVPTRFEIRDRMPLHKDLRLAIKTELVRRGVSSVDLFPVFAAAGFDPTHFEHDGHWSVLGHRIASEAITRELQLIGQLKNISKP